MAILDEITPKYYQPLTLGFERQGSDVVAVYNVMIRNVLGNEMKIINLASVLTPEEKAMAAAIYLRDEAQLEAATGLEKWIPPEPPEEP